MILEAGFAPGDWAGLGIVAAILLAMFLPDLIKCWRRRRNR